MERLEEGLIKIPPTMWEKAHWYAVRDICWWARDRAVEAGANLLRVAAEVLCRTHTKSVLPEKPYALTNERKIYQFVLDMGGLPDNYVKAASKKQWSLVISWEKETRTHGYWNVAHDALVIQPLSFGWFQRWPERCEPEELEILIKEMSATIEHELRHGVQFMLLAPVDPRQIAMNPDYDEHKSGYFTSPVEFDPTIGSAANEFVHYVEVLKQYGKNVNLKSAIRIYTAIDKGMLGGWEPNKFFKYLRAKDPQLWAKAVKKFYVEVGALLRRSSEQT